MDPFRIIQALFALATVMVIGCLFYTAYKAFIEPDVKAWRAHRRLKAETSACRTFA